ILNEGGQNPTRKRIGTAEPHFALGWISKELDVANALLEFVECCDPTVEQCATIDRRLDSPGAAVEETNAECLLQAGDDFRDGRLSNAKFAGGLSHAAALHDREKDLEVAKAEAPADAIF